MFPEASAEGSVAEEDAAAQDSDAAWVPDGDGGPAPPPAGTASTRSMNTAEELEMLKAESEQISLALDAIRKRMEALEKPDE